MCGLIVTPSGPGDIREGWAGPIPTLGKHLKVQAFWKRAWMSCCCMHGHVYYFQQMISWEGALCSRHILRSLKPIDKKLTFIYFWINILIVHTYAIRWHQLNQSQTGGSRPTQPPRIVSHLQGAYRCPKFWRSYVVLHYDLVSTLTSTGMCSFPSDLWWKARMEPLVLSSDVSDPLG